MSTNYTYYIDPRVQRQKLKVNHWEVAHASDSADVIFVNLYDQPAWIHTYRHNRPLNPVVYVGEHTNAYEFSLNALTPETLSRILHDIEPMLRKRDELPQSVIEHVGTDPHVTAAAYAWMRDQHVKVELHTASPKGYVYHFEECDKEAEAVFESLAISGYMDHELAEIAHSCPNCNSIQVLLRDACLDCKSVDIVEQPLLHHFRCGYQGNESSFLDAAGHYTCPKCHQSMRHFGVDYDKPGITILCHTCGHENHDTKIMGRCLNCHESFPGERADRKQIYDYLLNENGVHAMFQGHFGIYDPQKLLSQELTLIEPDRLIMLGQKLAAIQQRHGLKTLVLEVSLGDIESSGEAVGKKVSLLTQIGKELALFVRPTDAVAYNLGQFILLLPGSGEEVVELLEQRITEVIRSKFNDEITADLRFEHFQATERFTELMEDENATRSD